MYGDLTGEKAVLDLYTVALEGTEVVDGRECYVLKLTGRKPTIAYPMERMWVDAELFVARKATSFSLSGKAIKEMTAGDFRVVAGRSIPGRVEMRDLMKKGSSTAFKVAKIAIDVPIDPKVFTREELSW